MTNELEQNKRPEPFATLMDLVAEHGVAEVLSALSDLAAFEAEEEDNCPGCRRQSWIIHHTLDGLVTGVFEPFPGEEEETEEPDHSQN